MMQIRSDFLTILFNCTIRKASGENPTLAALQGARPKSIHYKNRNYLEKPIAFM